MKTERSLIQICLLGLVMLQAVNSGAQPVTKIAAGAFHSLFLKNDGSLWAMGWNLCGQLGDGTTNNVNVPERIVASNVTAIATGYGHSLFLKNDGSLWAMGWNLSGQLGDGTTNNVNVPERIVASNVTAIAAGWYFSLFIKSDGSLSGMGNNGGGQLGDGTTADRMLPELIVASNVTAIAAGGFHSLFLRSEGSFWAMGWNADGQLGNGAYDFVGVSFPQQILPVNVTAVAAGGHHSLFLKNDGSLCAMGENLRGQLGDGSYHQTTLFYEQIVAAYNRISFQLLNDGSVQLSFVGMGGVSYALDRSSGLMPFHWVSQATNPADALGVLVFTNPTEFGKNNFWRIRSVP